MQTTGIHTNSEAKKVKFFYIFSVVMHVSHHMVEIKDGTPVWHQVCTMLNLLSAVIQWRIPRARFAQVLNKL